jgi:hypothetical protein
MVEYARLKDPGGHYNVIEDGNFQSLPRGGFDLVQSAFTFDNISGTERRAYIIQGLASLLDVNGILVNIVSTPEIYTNEWVTFSTRDYPENYQARCGEVVRIVTTEYSDARPVEDILWSHENYLRMYEKSGLRLVGVERPLARGDEGIEWKSETCIAPWAIYVLERLKV